MTINILSYSNERESMHERNLWCTQGYQAFSYMFHFALLRFYSYYDSSYMEDSNADLRTKKTSLEGLSNTFFS